MSDSTALVVIDAQVDMFDPSCPVAHASSLIARIAGLIARARAANVPIVFIRNNGGIGDPDEPGTPGWEIHPDLRPDSGDMVVGKSTGNAFDNTPLDAALKKLHVSRLVMTGLQSEYCVRDTVLGALSHNYAVTLVADGHSTYAADGRAASEICAAVNAELQDRVGLLRAKEVAFQ
jgi:nicotinamidase-related amidase